MRYEWFLLVASAGIATWALTHGYDAFGVMMAVAAGATAFRVWKKTRTPNASPRGT